jgi:hypothetical protein
MFEKKTGGMGLDRYAVRGKYGVPGGQPLR